MGTSTHMMVTPMPLVKKRVMIQLDAKKNAPTPATQVMILRSFWSFFFTKAVTAPAASRARPTHMATFRNLFHASVEPMFPKAKPR
jgi:hypothetical protein